MHTTQYLVLFGNSLSSEIPEDIGRLYNSRGNLLRRYCMGVSLHFHLELFVEACCHCSWVLVLLFMGPGVSFISRLVLRDE
jgi:hypothetical protein